jgi:hypothetical protein
MAYTTAQLRTLTLQELGVLAAGETPSADDAQLTDAALVRLHSRLEGKGLTTKAGVSWTIATVPDYAGESYAFMAAAILAGRYGLPADRRAELMALSVEAEREIRRQTYTAWDGGPTELDGVQDPDSIDDMEAVIEDL